MKGKVKQIFVHIFNIAGLGYSVFVGIGMLDDLSHNEEVMPLAVIALITAAIFAASEAINILFAVKRKYHIAVFVGGIAASAMLIITSVVSVAIAEIDESGIVLLLVIPLLISAAKLVFDILIFKNSKKPPAQENKTPTI